MKRNIYAYIHTIGCQMNTYDSEKFMVILAAMGYEKTEDLEKADIVICNTCSIRKKAQEKAFSFLGKIAGKKNSSKGPISVMAGCVAQQEGRKVFKRIPNLDIVLGTQAFSRLESHVRAVQEGRTRIADTDESNEIFELMPDGSEEQKVTRFVTIMQGCDNYCTYCVVPHVRGRERSRDPEKILQEIQALAAANVKEVTLLGQNVNSYGQKEGVCSFPKLLDQVSAIDGIQRIRFATSHPKDLSDDLIAVMRDNSKVCSHLHLPVQSGSNRILKKMNRKYTKEIYLERIARLRSQCPGVALSSDMIVGFPSETREEFHRTLDLVKTVEFDGLFAFSYSHRPNAPASKFSDEVDEQEKMARLNELLELQEIYTRKNNQACVGKIEPVLVEGESAKKRGGHDREEEGVPQMTGRTSSGKIVHFSSPNAVPGDILNVTIEKAYAHSLWGRV
ncbi:MAG: tRNA (N6-isopentenyl adenosine(37)-C2)-methylthiotransferase MiaB [Desulfobacteraceae bacterium]